MSQEKPVYQPGTGWNIALNMIWFGQNWKWFILLLAILPGQVEAVVGPDRKNAVWGALFAAGAVWASFGPALFGGWSDRVGRRKIFISIGTASTVAALAFIANGNQLWMLIVGYFFLQVSDDIQQGAYSSLIPQVVPEDHQGRASAMMGGLSLFANICAAISGLVIPEGALFGMTKVQAIYFLIAVVQVISGAAVLWAIRNLREPFERESSGLSSWRSWLEAWKHRDFVIVWLVRLLVAMGYYLIQPFLRNYLVDGFAQERVVEKANAATGVMEKVTEHGLTFFGKWVGDAEMGVYIIGLTISLTGALAAFITAKKLDTVGKRKMLTIAGVIMCAIMIPFAFVRDFTIAWLLASLFGAGYGLYMSASWAQASGVMPDKERLGQDMGLWQSGNTAAQISPAIVGPIIDQMNRGGGVTGYMMAILLAGVVILAGCLLARKVEGSN